MHNIYNIIYYVVIILINKNIYKYTHSGHSEHLMGNFAPSARFDLEEVRGEITWGSYTVQGARMT